MRIPGSWAPWCRPCSAPNQHHPLARLVLVQSLALNQQEETHTGSAISVLPNTTVNTYCIKEHTHQIILDPNQVLDIINKVSSEVSAAREEDQDAVHHYERVSG